MSIPKTTKLTLKRIVEALPDIPANGFGTEPPKMSSEQKKKLMELSAMYENFGECLRNEEALMNAAKGITELCELAETYALNECGEWFQQEIVKKDMQNLKKRVSEFQKIVKETYARMQQAGVAYQDIGHVLGRYYDLKGVQGSNQKYNEVPGPQPLQETESDPTTRKSAKMADPMLAKGVTVKKKVNEGRRICAWCKKDLGAFEGEGDSHGICPVCREKMMTQIKGQAPQPPASPEVKEGRCEDWPCCGHEAGDCPDRDEQGNEVWSCASCGRRLPPMSPSSLCSKCIGRLHRSMDDPTGQDMDDFQH